MRIFSTQLQYSRVFDVDGLAAFPGEISQEVAKLLGIPVDTVWSIVYDGCVRNEGFLAGKEAAEAAILAGEDPEEAYSTYVETTYPEDSITPAECRALHGLRTFLQQCETFDNSRTPFDGRLVPRMFVIHQMNSGESIAFVFTPDREESTFGAGILGFEKAVEQLIGHPVTPDDLHEWSQLPLSDLLAMRPPV